MSLKEAPTVEYTANFESANNTQFAQTAEPVRVQKATTTWASNSSAYVGKLNTSQPLGAWKSLKVSKGDKIRMSALAYYSASATTNNANNVRLFVLPLPNFTTTNSETGNNPSWLNAGLLFIGGGSNNAPNGLPKAYLRCILSDEAGTPLAYREANVSVTPNLTENLQILYEIPTNGVLQVFVGNESNADVFFDDVLIRHEPDLICQENHYDPWGLNLAGIEKAGKPDDKFQYNGKEKIEDFDLSWIDYGWRNYDPQLGRWHGVDMLADSSYSFSPYHYAGNNPTIFVDPDGNDYGLYFDHENKTVTVKATYYTSTSDANSARQATAFWNNQSGKFSYSVKDGDKTIDYTVNFELTVSEVTIGVGEDKTAVLDNHLRNDNSGEGNIYQVVPDNTHGFDNKNGITAGGNKVAVTERRAYANRGETGSHEIGHSLGLGHYNKGIMTEGSSDKGRGLYLRNKDVQIIVRGGIKGSSNGHAGNGSPHNITPMIQDHSRDNGSIESVIQHRSTPTPSNFHKGKVIAK
jgi:RHS repeat-associated protein